MHSLVVSFIVFGLVFGGALVGMWVRRVLPLDHLGSDTKDTMRLAIGLVVTMTSLVLGMLVSSAKTYYDGQKNVVAQMSSDIILLNGLLKGFDPASKDLRAELRSDLDEAIDRIWPKEGSRLSQLKPKDAMQSIYTRVEVLVPKNAAEVGAKTRIVTTVEGLKRTYWLMYLNSEQTTVSMPLLIVVTTWLVTIFMGFGIFAPPNSTMLFTFAVCAIAVSAAIFIIMEMYSPFGGIMKISPVAVRDALSQMAPDR
jgi:hypothetical protein